MVEESLSRAEEDRNDRDVHLVDQASAQILLDRGRAATQPDVEAIGRLESARQCRLDSVGDEVERRPAFHRDVRTWVVGEYEDLMVIRRVVAPPALPALIGPWAPDRSEHVAAHDRGADAGIALHHETVVDALVALLLAKHSKPGACLENPFVEQRPSHSERIVDVLVRTGAVTVDRDREIVDPQLRHSGYAFPLTMRRHRHRRPRHLRIPRRRSRSKNLSWG